MSRQIVEIETKTFIRFWLVIFGFGFILWFIVRAQEALVMIGIAGLLALAIHPLASKVDRLIGRKSQNNLSSVLAYLIVLLVIASVVAVIAPVIVSEFSKFLTALPDTIKNADLSGLNEFAKNFGIDNLSAEISRSVEDFSHSFLSGLGDGVVSGISALGGIIGKAGITLVLSLFFLIEGPDLFEHLWTVLGAKKNAKDLKEEKDSDIRFATEARVVISKMAKVVSTFVSKQVAIALLDGAVVAASVATLCFIFGRDAYIALPMGMISMTFYLIPMFGQVIGASLVTLILAITNPLMAVIWLAFYIVYGFIEVNAIAPKIQGNALKLRPIVILIAMIIGTYMFGLIGAIIAIPIAGCIKVLLEEYPTIRKIRQ